MSLGFHTALSALNTAQRALAVIGHNLANAGNAGYTRQRVDLTSLQPTAAEGGNLFIGRGVDIAQINRVADALLDTRVRAQESEVARQSVLRDSLLELEAIFGEPGTNGLAGRFSGFFSALSGLTANPSDGGLRSGVVQSGTAVADAFRLVRQQLGSLNGSFDDAVKVEVRTINELTAEISQLNNQIAAARVSRDTPATFVDRQEQLLRELSKHIEFQVDRDAAGKVTLVSGGALLVNARSSIDLVVTGTSSAGGQIAIRADRSSAPFLPRSGRLRGLLDVASTSVAERTAAIDKLARNLIREVNAAHSTGVPSDGGYRRLESLLQFQDQNGTGTVLDDTLQEAGLPFEISSGALYVNVTEQATGAIKRTRIDIDPATMTVEELQDALSAIPNLTASVDRVGKLRVFAAEGFRFDFSNRLLPQENLGRTLGAQQATLTGGAAGPYALAPGQSFTLSVDGGAPQTVTFNASQFSNIFQARPEEVAAVINGQISGASAEVVDGRVVLRSATVGSTSTLQLTNASGDPLGALGLSSALERGGDQQVKVSLGGSYTGGDTRNLVATAVGRGTIGVTPGLKINVTDASTGTLIGTLDVGDGYQPGDPLELMSGVHISFGPGEISQAAGDRFEMTLVGDSDTSDILVATGLGGFFGGYDASTMQIASTLQSDSRNLAAGLSAAPGDNRNLLRLQGIRENGVAGLDGLSVDRFYESVISELGNESRRAQDAQETQSLVLESLDARRESISGVNVDEELLLMQQFQQLYQVAGRFLQTMQDVNDVLMSIVR